MYIYIYIYLYIYIYNWYVTTIIHQWPRLRGRDPGIAGVDHQDLDESGAGGFPWWFFRHFHGEILGSLGMSENEENATKEPWIYIYIYQSHGETENTFHHFLREIPMIWMNTPNCLGADIQWFHDGFGMGRNIWCSAIRGMDLHKHTPFGCENLGGF